VALSELRDNTMMAHLMDALDRGEDIGHYGRLVFAMVAMHFAGEDEVVRELKKDADCDEEKARALVKQVESRGYNPPKRDRILEWMDQQSFDICPDAGDKRACDVYSTLKFPSEVYEKISSFYREQAR